MDSINSPRIDPINGFSIKYLRQNFQINKLRFNVERDMFCYINLISTTLRLMFSFVTFTILWLFPVNRHTDINTVSNLVKCASLCHKLSLPLLHVITVSNSSIFSNSSCCDTFLATSRLDDSITYPSSMNSSRM